MSIRLCTDYVILVMYNYMDRLWHSGSGQTMSLWLWTDLCHSGYEQTNVTQVYYWLRTSCLIRHNTSKCRQVLVNLGLGSFFPWVCPSPWNIVFYNLIHKKNWGLSCSLSFKYLSGLHTWQTSSAKYLRGSGIPLTITITIIEEKKGWVSGVAYLWVMKIKNKSHVKKRGYSLSDAQVTKNLGLVHPEFKHPGAEVISHKNTDTNS